MISGWKTKVGIVEETTYGTARVVTNQIPFLSEGILEEPTTIIPPVVSGGGSYRYMRLSGIKYSGPLSLFPFYGATAAGLIGRLIEKVALGTEYQYSDLTDYVLYPDGQPGSFTLCIDKEGTVHEYTGGKVLAITISADVVWSMSVDLIFQDHTTTGVNTSSSGWTLADSEPIFFVDTVLTINDFSAGTPTDEYTIRNFSVSVTNDYIIKRTKSSGLLIDEPRRKKRDCAVSIGLVDEGTFQDDIDNQTYKKGWFKSSANIGGTAYSRYIYFPKFRILDMPVPVGGESIVEPVINLQLFKTESPTGFPAGLDTEIIFRNTKG